MSFLSSTSNWWLQCLVVMSKIFISFSFIHLLNKYILSAYCVPETVVNAEDTVAMLKKMAKNNIYIHHILVIQQTSLYVISQKKLESVRSGRKHREGFCEAIIFESGELQ